MKEARNQSRIFNRKSISRNTTHRQSYHLQAVLTGVKRWKANTRSEKVNNLKTAMKKLRAHPTATNKSKPKTSCLTKSKPKTSKSKPKRSCSTFWFRFICCHTQQSEGHLWQINKAFQRSIKTQLMPHPRATGREVHLRKENTITAAKVLLAVKTTKPGKATMKSDLKCSKPWI